MGMNEEVPSQFIIPHFCIRSVPTYFPVYLERERCTLGGTHTLRLPQASTQEHLFRRRMRRNQFTAQRESNVVKNGDAVHHKKKLRGK